MSCLIHEVVARQLPPSATHLWDIYPLETSVQASVLNSRDIVERIRERMDEEQPDLLLLECYAAVLRIGFGQQRAHGQTTRFNTLAKSLNVLLAKLRAETARTERAVAGADAWTVWLNEMPAWMPLGVFGTGALCLYRCGYLLLTAGMVN